MTPFEKAVYLLALGELGQITSAELRSELGALKEPMKEAVEASAAPAETAAPPQY